MLPHPFIQVIVPTSSHDNVPMIKTGPIDSFSRNFSFLELVRRVDFLLPSQNMMEGKGLVAVMCPASCELSLSGKTKLIHEGKELGNGEKDMM